MSRRTRLSLWESWHAEGVTERVSKGPLQPGIRRATSPKGRGLGSVSAGASNKEKRSSTEEAAAGLSGKERPHISCGLWKFTNDLQINHKTFVDNHMTI